MTGQPAVHLHDANAEENSMDYLFFKLWYWVVS
jgi:hypothetical protein